MIKLGMFNIINKLNKSVNSIMQLLYFLHLLVEMIPIYYLSISNDLYTYVPEEALRYNGHAGKTGSIFLIKLIHFVLLARGHKLPPLRPRSPR